MNYTISTIICTTLLITCVQAATTPKAADSKNAPHELAACVSSAQLNGSSKQTAAQAQLQALLKDATEVISSELSSLGAAETMLSFVNQAYELAGKHTETDFKKLTTDLQKATKEIAAFNQEVGNLNKQTNTALQTITTEHKKAVQQLQHKQQELLKQVQKLTNDYAQAQAQSLKKSVNKQITQLKDKKKSLLEQKKKPAKTRVASKKTT